MAHGQVGEVYDAIANGGEGEGPFGRSRGRRPRASLVGFLIQEFLRRNKRKDIGNGGCIQWILGRHKVGDAARISVPPVEYVSELLRYARIFNVSA
jgi:hypothetical protein